MNAFWVIIYMLPNGGHAMDVGRFFFNSEADCKVAAAAEAPKYHNVLDPQCRMIRAAGDKPANWVAPK